VLSNIGARVRFARGETIFNEGDDAAFSYLVVSGAIRLCKHLADGRRQIADFVLPGSYCGFLHLDRHRFTAEAASDLEVLSYPQRSVEALAEKYPDIRRLMTDFLGHRLAAVQDHLMMLGHQTAKERVLRFLLTLAENAGAQDDETVRLLMSRQDIADYLGLTIETVCRVLSDLRRTRIIATPDVHSFVLKDIESVRELLEFGE